METKWIVAAVVAYWIGCGFFNAMSYLFRAHKPPGWKIVVWGDVIYAIPYVIVLSILIAPVRLGKEIVDRI